MMKFRQLIQAGGEILLSVIHKLINYVWKGDKTDYINYRVMSLLSTSYKMLMNILLSRLGLYIDEIIGDHQCGFRRNRSTTDSIKCIHQILKKKKYSHRVCGTLEISQVD
jgi:hypothetical protein